MGEKGNSFQQTLNQRHNSLILAIHSYCVLFFLTEWIAIFGSLIETNQKTHLKQLLVLAKTLMLLLKIPSFVISRFAEKNNCFC